MKRYLFLAVAALLLVGCLHPAKAQIAPEVSVGVGIGHYRHRSDGTWYDSAFPHTFKKNAAVGMLGVAFSPVPSVRLHVDAVDLGHYTVDAQAIPMDWAYKPTAANHCIVTPCPPLAHYVGQGSVYGLQALVELRHGHFGVEAGPLWFHEAWGETIPNWYNAKPDGSGGYVVTQRAAIHTADHLWALGGVAGLTFSAGRFTMALDYVKDAKNFSRNNGHWPPGWASTVVAWGRVSI